MQIHSDAATGAVPFRDSEVRFHDSGAPGGAEPIVLLHGTGGSALMHYRTVYPMLASRHRVLAIDFAPADVLDDLVDQVVSVLDARAPGQRVTLVGYSLGAVVAARAAAQLGERVGRLVLLCGWARTDAAQRLRYALWRRLFTTDPEALNQFGTFAAFGQPYLMARTDREIRALVEGRRFSDDVGEQMAINDTVDITADLEKIVSPTLVIGGVYDQMVPLRHSQLLFGAIDDARLAEIPTGHAATVERPAQVFKLIDDFVRNRPETVSSGVVLDTSVI